MSLVLCSVLSPKSSCWVCTGWLKSIVAHSKKLLQGYLPSVHTSVPPDEHCSMAPSWPLFLKRQNVIFQIYPIISPSVTQGISSPQLIVQSLPAALSCSLPLPDFAPQKGSLPFQAAWLSSPPVHCSALPICHVLSLQLCRLLILRSYF